MTKVRTHFVVVRRNWRPAGHGGTYVLVPGEVRESSFALEQEAREEAALREADARRKVNPFRCGTTWVDRCHLPESVFSDFLRDGGIAPPAKASRSKKKPPVPLDWAAWWEKKGAKLGEAERQRVWEGLDRLRFYEVREQPVRPVAYAVVEVQWNYNDEWYYPGTEGGHSLVAYRSRERAEQERARLDAEARERWRRDLRLPAMGAVPRRWDMHELFPFDMQTRRFAGQDPFGPLESAPARSAVDVYGEEDEEDRDLESGEFGVDEVPFYEVVEIELEEGN
jgi:hypothetical protein